MSQEFQPQQEVSGQQPQGSSQYGGATGSQMGTQTGSQMGTQTGSQMGTPPGQGMGPGTSPQIGQQPGPQMSGQQMGGSSIGQEMGSGTMGQEMGLRLSDVETAQQRTAVEDISRAIQVCGWCADQCIQEADPSMTECIRLCEDVTELGETTLALLPRNSRFADAVLNTFQQAAEACARECGQHPHAHCQECAEELGYASESVGQLLETFGQQGGTYGQQGGSYGQQTTTW